MDKEKILSESIKYLNMLTEDGIVNDDELSEIVENENITAEDLENFVSEMNSVMEEIESEEYLDEAIMWLDALYEQGIIDESDLSELFGDEELTMENVISFVNTMNETYTEEDEK